VRIAVLIKQVPRTDKIRIDKESGTLIRKGVESILNPYCEYALDLAVALKKRHKDIREIIAFTMGPASAELVLRRALALGADRGVLLSDRAFSGADCWATAYTLSRGIISILGDPQIIICGKQAIDGDTAQVPGEISEIMKIPVLPYVTEVKTLDDKMITVVSEFENELIKLHAPFPVLITAGSGSNIRRFPCVKDVLRAYKSDIVILDKDKAGCNDIDIGLKGSPTRVVKIEPLVSKGTCSMFEENSFKEGIDAVKKLFVENCHEKN
jgi:electron transfer flavoprotein beta subunit